MQHINQNKIKMKKLFFLLISIVLLVACSNEENNIVNENPNSGLPFSFEGIYETEADGSESVEIAEKRIAANPEMYKSNQVETNTELWDSQISLRAEKALQVSDWDVKQLVSSYKTIFYQGYFYDNRITRGITYVVNIYHYKKSLQIPKGASLIPAPSSAMNVDNMGYIPGTYGSDAIVGYKFDLASTNSTHDTYYAITEVREITHNVSGQQIAPAHDPVYIPGKITNPHNFVFKYQYKEEIEW